MVNAIHIRSVGSSRLVYELRTSAGALVATSAEFPTICRLETGLAALLAASEAMDTVTIEREANLITLVPASGRGRVRLLGEVNETALRDALTGARSSSVVDDRPVGRRRTDLSGRLCDIWP
jgi:hypothetical protein